MVRYACTSCNYRFDADSISDCPYCGREGDIEKEKNAEELLSEVSKITN